jgi:hypothetical protein
MLPSKRKERLSRVRECSEARRMDELGAFFYEESVEMAVRFVQEQIARGDDSPFRGVPKDRFFHEVVTVNFWALEKLFGAKHAGLVARVLDNYARFFHHSPKGNVPQWIAERFTVYTGAWNDVTGHQDLFGRRVAEHIFPQGQAFSVPETSYWIIEYAHDVLDDFREMRDLCRSMKIHLP